MTITTVCISTFRHKPGVAGIRLVDLQGFREVVRCYTIGPAIVTPEIGASALPASVFGRAVSDLAGWLISTIVDEWIL
jgi:hypothetical protein